MASSSRTPSVKKHDVFISFRGGDSRYNFVSHLSHAFSAKGINAFIDDRIDKGEEIWETLFNNIISDCWISVVVLTKNYADSPWCLDELVQILECRAQSRQTVLPIFLGVEPTHVRHQTGAFGDGFRRLIVDQRLKSKEETWRWALRGIANLDGWDSKVIRSEAKIIDGVVRCVEGMVYQIYSKRSNDFFVRIASVEELKSLLRHPGSAKDVSSIGIWGMGGIGKTTLATKVYYEIAQLFHAKCFLENVSERLQKQGADALSKDMLSQLLESDNLHTPPNFLSPVVQRILERKTVLIILDDVDDCPKLKSLVEKRKFYGPGSRIILTSRDKKILEIECDAVYEVKGLDFHNSRQLLMHHAFKQQVCTEEYNELLAKAVNYAQGLPLALQDIGHLLCDKGRREWEYELTKLENIPHKGVEDVLMLSYDGLEEWVKGIFLDIACFLNGRERTFVERILGDSGSVAARGIDRLLDMGLINIANNTIWMHNLLQQVGQNIVSKENIFERGKRSRLWTSDDIRVVLTRNNGTENVRAISLNTSEEEDDMHLTPTVFKKMCNLIFLSITTISEQMPIRFPGGLRYLPNSLRYLKWDRYPLTYLPYHFQPEELFHLEMNDSRLKELWSDGVDQPCLPNLRVIDVSQSKELGRLPNFYKTPNLEILKVDGCESLDQVPASIRHLIKLEELCMDGCTRITSFRELPPNILKLDLSRTAIGILPSSIENLSKLQELWLRYCENLTSLPENFGELKILKKLSLHECAKLERIPESFGNLKSLKHLWMNGTAVRSLPDRFCNLSSLEILSIKNCRNLNELPQRLGYMKSLQSLSMEGSPIKSLPSFIIHFMERRRGVVTICSLSPPNKRGGLASLRVLDFQNSDLESLPAINLLLGLTELYLKDCKNLKSLPELPSGLQILGAMNCTSLEAVDFGQTLSGGFQFDFFNCLNLNGDAKTSCMRYAWQRMGDMVISQTQSNQEPTNKETCGAITKGKDPFEGRAILCIPGGEVPRWFEHRNHGSSLKVQLSGGRRLDLGQLAFCFVAASNCCGPNGALAECKCTLTTVSGEQDVRICGFSYHLNHDDSMLSKHIYLWYDERDQLRDPPIYFTEAIFEFQASERGHSYFEILECGVTSFLGTS